MRKIRFTPKEKKVLRMIVKGSTCKEMAAAFNNSLGRIYDIRATMLRKTGHKNMLQLCYYVGINKIV